MKYLKQFIKSVFEAIWPIILANPLAFMGVTGVFICMIITSEDKCPASIEEGIILFVLYIIFLCVFMGKKLAHIQKKKIRNNDINTMKNTNISLFTIFKVKK